MLGIDGGKVGCPKFGFLLFKKVFRSSILSILSVFFGFKFLPNKEEKNNFPPEEGGILEEFLPLDLEYISPVQIQL